MDRSTPAAAASVVIVSGLQREAGRMPCENMLAAGEVDQDNRAVRRHENTSSKQQCRG
jgi:hypothetical protein